MRARARARACVRARLCDDDFKILMYAQLTVLNRSVIFAKCHGSCKTCEKIVRHKVCFIFIYKLGNIFAYTETEQVQRDVRSRCT